MNNMKYKHPDGRILYLSNSHTGGQQWGVFWNSSTGGSHRIKTIPMSADYELVSAKFQEYANKNKCVLVDEEMVEDNTTVEKKNSLTVLRPGLLDDKLNIIRIKSKAIIQNFVEIGSVFLEIDENKLYIEKGYNNIIEMAQTEVNMSKTTLYNLIGVAKKFTSGGRLIEGYENYSFSQLVELVSAPDEIRPQIDPGTTVKQIQKLKKDNKEQQSKKEEKTPENQNGHTSQNKRENTGTVNKNDTYTCPDSDIVAKMPFPNFMCRECKKNQSCFKYREKKDIIEQSIKENAGISLDESGSSLNIAEKAKEELQQDQQINDEKNSKMVQLANELLEYLESCIKDDSFKLLKEADRALTQIGQLRVSIIEKERQLKNQ